MDPPEVRFEKCARRRGDRARDASAVIDSVSSELPTEQEQVKRWTELLCNGDAIERAGAAEVFRQWASLGVWDANVIWETLTTADGRNQLLCDANAGVEVLCSGLIETMWRDASHDWKSYLSHYFALAALDSRLNPEQRGHIADAAVIACISANSCSAIQRLSAGNRRTGIRNDLQRAKNTLENPYSKAPPWLMARFRAIAAALRAAI